MSYGLLPEVNNTQSFIRSSQGFVELKMTKHPRDIALESWGWEDWIFTFHCFSRIPTLKKFPCGTVNILQNYTVQNFSFLPFNSGSRNDVQAAVMAGQVSSVVQISFHLSVVGSRR